jgi:integrase
MEGQERSEAVKAGCVDAPLPNTLAMLLRDFLAEHAEKKLAAKTVERYREQTAYLSPVLLAMPLREITALHLSREWSRLLQSGGHHRKTKAPRSLSAKTVRNIAGVVSSVFARAIKWGLAPFNPVTNSEMPVVRRKKGIALTPAQQRGFIDSAKGVWCLPVFLELSAATGARRGEVLALRWADVQNGEVIVSRSLSQTKRGWPSKARKPTRSGRSLCPNQPSLRSKHIAVPKMLSESSLGRITDQTWT